MEDDRTLIARFLQGDQRAFDGLVLAHQEKVRQFLYRATGDVDETNDLAQEVFIKVYHHLHRFRGDSEFSTWLYRVTANVLNSYFRKQRLRSWIPLGEREDLEARPRGDDQDERFRELLAQLPKLSAQERQVVILRGLQELPVADTARILDTSENAVKVAYHSARKKLKELLQDEP
ncbi:MAG: RNA polymerase sigma factor [Fidelibacterota bacterium]|nr:MAG: RNA polymerase sigma factor [Candidatus Neomarinimicrobiota bacterium]